MNVPTYAYTKPTYTTHTQNKYSDVDGPWIKFPREQPSHSNLTSELPDETRFSGLRILILTFNQNS